MALCLADSLLEHGRLVPQDLRLRFCLWWRMGLNNAFALDELREAVSVGGRGSVGLGGTIEESMAEFINVA